ncbi:MAG: thioredoxin family protein [Candidatus Theseobacter exili]|nr:thioredoxin family protein [Candidatus Theseobacter exili]
MLDTNLKHVESQEELKELFNNNANVMVCCGRMGPMCLPVYAVMEKLEQEYSHVRIVDMDFDIRVASSIKNLPECSFFMGLPFTVYFKNGRVVGATTSIQNEKEIRTILDNVFEKTEEADHVSEKIKAG